MPITRLAALGAALLLPVTAGGFVLAAPAAAVVDARSAAAEVDAFYRARGGARLWLAPGSGGAAQQLLQLISTAQLDGLDPRRYDARGVAKALRAAGRGDPRSVMRAEQALSQAFVAYAGDLARDPGVGIIYVDPELRPAPLPPRALLSQAANARSLGDYVARPAG